MTTHVFIVDLTTFKIHLEYLFAGTGAKEHAVDFNNNPNSNLHHSVEDMLVGMSADACRIRRGDNIIFYLQQDLSNGIREGKFFGIFRAAADCSFLDNNDGQQYLKSELKKSLTFRTLIEPDVVYAEGVTEWEALDEIKNICSPNQMLWSLIYRKLKANRGNTMITIYEAERLCQLIRNKNQRHTINVNGKKLSFDKSAETIIALSKNQTQYAGRQEAINILPRLITKCNSKKKFESHLQSYIVRNIGTKVNQSLNNSIIPKNHTVEWLGNEVSCGVGMQRIDIALSAVSSTGQRVFIPIELKAVEASVDNVRQINRYVDWIEQYYTPNRQSDIQPILVAKEFAGKNNQKYSDVIDSLRRFNQENSSRCQSIKYVKYHLHNTALVFMEVQY
jgi:hypothetical protein